VDGDLTDGELVRLARAGDAVAFRLLVERHRPTALARIRRIGADVHEADDIVQEAFLQAFLGLPRLRDPDRFAGWLGGILGNVYRAAVRRRETAILLERWPEAWHPATADGLVDAEHMDRRQALAEAVATLPGGQRSAVELFYYADQSVERTAACLASSPGSVKVALHKARARLREHITTHRPDLVPYLSRRTVMTTVRLAHAVPLPDERHAHHIGVVLADDAGRRALPLWVNGVLYRQFEVAEELTSRLLRATGARVTSVDVDELGPEVTMARIELDGPAGHRSVPAQLAEGLVLAAAHDAAIRVPDRLLDQWAHPLPADPRALLDRAHPSATAEPGRKRGRRPRNLAFAEGLDGWELRGSFLRDVTARHWQDYRCAATGQGSAILAAAVRSPYGFADLRQGVLAKDYRGRTIHFRGRLRADQVADRAGIYLRVVTEQSARRNVDNRVVAAVEGSDWVSREVSVEVPHDAVFVLFGLTLAGPGEIELRDAELAP
jgi:RNA polymerase sigma-70 factor (ECF subfamily)